jgi:hypothetical protein
MVLNVFSLYRLRHCWGNGLFFAANGGSAVVEETGNLLLVLK